MVNENSDNKRETKLPALRPLIDWFYIHRRDFNWRQTNEPYKVWVSEVMSQQTRADTVSLYFARFMERFPTIDDLASAEEVVVLKIWEGLGYYSRARNLQKTAKIIVEEYGGRFPETAAELRKLPGIGPYTAGAIASFCFNETEPAVDGNVVRITSRLLDLDFTQGDVKDRITTHKLLLDYMLRNQEQSPAAINESFMTLGATLCIPRTPKCEVCPMFDSCLARQSGRAALLPYKKAGRKIPAETLTYVILESRDGRFLLGRRPAGLLHGLWQHLSLDGHYSEDELNLRLDMAGLDVLDLRSLGERRHVFSHLVWDMEVWHARLSRESTDPQLQRLTSISLDEAVDESTELLLSDSIEPYLSAPQLEERAWIDREAAAHLPFSTALSSFLPWMGQ